MVLNELKFQLKRPGTVITFVILMWFVICNYLQNVLLFQGRDISNAIQPMKLLFVSYNKTYESADISSFFVMAFPFLCVIPSGFSAYSEYVTGNDVFVKARIGESRYFVNKLIVAFLSTFIVFLTPILLEIAANYLSFPKGIGDLSLCATYDSAYRELKSHYLFEGLYNKNILLYVIFMGCLLAAFAGMLAVMTVAFSFAVKVKLRVFLFIPCYVFLELSSILEKLFHTDEYTKLWFHYLLLFDDERKKTGVLAAYLIAIIIVTMVFIFIQNKRNSFYDRKKK